MHYIYYSHLHSKYKILSQSGWTVGVGKIFILFYQGIIDSTGTETRQFFSRLFVMAKNLKSCSPLPKIE